MTNNDLFYVCTLIETVARQTLNSRRTVVEALTIKGIKKQLHDAPVNHCLTLEQVSDEIIHQYGIGNGTFDTVTNMKYSVPSSQDIGKLYAILVEKMTDEKSVAERVFSIFSSFISDEISRFSTDLYYQNPDYLLCCYEEGRILM